MSIEKREPTSQLLELLDRVLRGGIQVEPWLRAQSGGIELERPRRARRSSPDHAADRSARRIPENRRSRAA
jgi:hypothetical protein